MHSKIPIKLDHETFFSRVASVSVNEENDKKIQNDMKGNENDKNQYE